MVPVALTLMNVNKKVFVATILSVSTSLAVQTVSVKMDIPKIPAVIAQILMSATLATSLAPKIPSVRTLKVATHVNVLPATLQMVTLVRILTSVTLLVALICWKSATLATQFAPIYQALLNAHVKMAMQVMRMAIAVMLMNALTSKVLAVPCKHAPTPLVPLNAAAMMVG